MERLLYSSPRIPLKVNLIMSPRFSPRVCRIDSAKLKLNFNFPVSSCTELRKVHSVSCKSENLSLPFSAPSNISPSPPSALAGSLNGSVLHPSPPFAVGASGKRNVMFIILSALITILAQPVFPPAAFATFQSAAINVGPAAKTALLSSAWAGFLAGCLHTLSGPDHLAALAPLSIGCTRMESAAVGALWGAGHDAGQVIFGLLFLLLKDQLHIEVLSTWGTRVVGITLLIIGVIGIREASDVPTPCVALENGECDVSIYETTLDKSTVGKKKIGFATFATGVVHGLQPDALMMVLPALALPSRLAGAAFLVMFLVGTVAAMVGYTVFLGSCSQALKERMPRITEKLTWAASFVAIALGFAILISQFFGYSLY